MSEVCAAEQRWPPLDWTVTQCAPSVVNQAGEQAVVVRQGRVVQPVVTVGFGGAEE